MLFWVTNNDLYREIRLLQEQVGKVTSLLNLLLQKGTLVMAAIDDLEARVAAQTTVISSAVTLLTELKVLLDDAIASGDPARIQAVSDQIGSHTQSLADAVAANTPPEPEPEV